jgi:hypothetical protein
MDAMLEALLSGIRRWRGTAEFGDDISLLAIEVS